MAVQSSSGITRPVGRHTAEPDIWPLPPHPFFALAAATPVIILSGRLYYLVEEAADDRYFQFEDARYGLLSAQTLAELTAEYVQTHASLLTANKNHLIQAALQKQVGAEAEMKRQQNEQSMTHFLVYELVPFLQKAEHGRLLHPPPDRHSPAPAEMQPPDPVPLTPPDDLLADVLSHNAAILDGRIFPLTSLLPTDSCPDIWLHTPTAVYHLIYPGCFLQDAARDFTGHVEAQVQAQAAVEQLIHRQYWQRLAAATARAADPLPEALANGRDGVLYQGRQYAVMRRNGQWWVSTAVPDHVIEDRQGDLYHFDATQIGIAIHTLKSRRVLHSGAVVVLTACEHPFVAKPTKGAVICMAQPDGYYSRLQTRPLAEGIVQLLHDARQTLLTGYHASNYNQPYHTPSSFPWRQIERVSAAAHNLPTYSYHR